MQARLVFQAQPVAHPSILKLTIDGNHEQEFAVMWILQILTLLCATMAIALSVAHALEMPGKMRLGKEAYLAVQTIYYPGFTIGGTGEPVGMLLTFVLLFLLPARTYVFWLTLLALIGFLGMQAVYWFMTHPVNRYWLQAEKLGEAGTRFFGPNKSEQSQSVLQDWKRLRKRWEYSHVLRAAFATVSFVSLITSMTGNRSQAI